MASAPICCAWRAKVHASCRQLLLTCTIIRKGVGRATWARLRGQIQTFLECEREHFAGRAANKHADDSSIAKVFGLSRHDV